MGSILAESHNFIETLRKNNDKTKYITLENSLNNQSTDVLRGVHLIDYYVYLFKNQRYTCNFARQAVS